MDRYVVCKERKFSRKWDLLTCRNLALQYYYTCDFRREHYKAYTASQRNGWLKEFSWLVDGRQKPFERPSKWDYESCYAEARKYETKSDFMRGNGSAYHKALQKGWMAEYNWFIDGIARAAKNNKKWNYDTCLALARECKSVTEMMNISRTAFVMARTNDWIKEYTWFKHGNTKWTFEDCKAIALKYKVRRDFQEQDSKAYAAAVTHGWIKQFDWFVNGHSGEIRRPRTTPPKPAWNRKYTDEGAEVVARKYTTKRSFRENDNGWYMYSLRSGLMPKFTWLKSEMHLFDATNYVYRYFFENQNAVYVGRTINPKNRDIDHRRDRGSQSSAVFKFAQANRLDIPHMEILENGLTGEESQAKEDEYVQRYKMAGITVLNTGVTGIGAGSLGQKRKYSRQFFLRIAKQYQTLSAFAKEQHALYEAGCKYGWIKECNFLARKIRKSEQFTKEYCLEIARRCTSRKDLFDKDSSVYGKMLRNGWLDECPWLYQNKGYAARGLRTHDYCIEEAKKYTSVKEMKEKDCALMTKLYRAGWMKECTWLKHNKKPT